MGITAAGVGSGLDIESIVTQLMQLERRPLDALKERQTEYREELSAYGRLKSAVSAFQDSMEELGSLDKFNVYTSSSSDEEVAGISADSSAASGTFALEVTRLAQHHKMASGEFSSSDTFGGTAGDSLSIQVGSDPGDTLSVNLTTARTLSQIRDAINEDENNPGVTATILNTGGGMQRLVITADESGSEQQLQVSYGGSLTAADFGDGNPDTGAGNDGFETINRDSAGITLADLGQLDAAFTVDGFDVTSTSNTVKGVMDGVDFELKSTGSSLIQVERDIDAIKDTVEGFVEAYNSLQGSIANLQKGDLSGDSAPRSLQALMRGVLNTAPVGILSQFNALSQVGITTGERGTLRLDVTDLEDALDTDFAGLAQLFANDDQGFAFRFAEMAGQVLASDGLIDSRQDGINKSIRRLEDKQLSMEAQLELKEQHMRSQYAALDGLVGSLQATGNFLYQQLGA
jgi:flagellar hook-associated protein 2